MMIDGFSYWWLVVFLFWVFVIAGGIWVALTLAGRERPRSSAEDVLAERFARGEIDEDEYRKRRAALRERS